MIRISEIIKAGSLRKSDSEEKDKFTADALQSYAFKKTGKQMKKLYDEGVEIVKNIFNNIKNIRERSRQGTDTILEHAVDYNLLSSYINKVIEYLRAEQEEFLSFFYKPKKQPYLHEHSLNVCLMAIKIGMWRNMNNSALLELGMGAALHDLGLVVVEDVITESRTLKRDEKKRVKRHAEYSAKLLERIKGFREDVILAVKWHHRRLSDKGFPDGLNKGKQQIMAQIIGLADIYEAITHPRTYKIAKMPYEAVKELIEKEAGNFKPELMKSLIDNIGIYPVGSWIRLTSGEVGVVVATAKGYPLRPKINTLFDEKNNKLNSSRVVDLLEKPHLHIESPIDVNKEKALAEQLQ